jgi:hypothetical protein
MPNFSLRKLIGIYKNGSGGGISDFNKINNMFFELAKDIVAFNARIKVIEAFPLTTLTSSSFAANTILGTIILDGSLSGAKVTDGTITGTKLVLNSSQGITDANIAPSAAIKASKLDLSTLSHASLLNVGVLTHAQIESALGIIGTLASGNVADIATAENNISALQTVVGSATLNTTAQNITSAINELQADISSYVSPYSSGVVDIIGTQTQYSLLRCTGVDDAIEPTPYLQAYDGPGIAGLRSTTSLAIMTNGVSPQTDTNGNIFIGSANCSIWGLENIVAIAPGNEFRVYASGDTTPTARFTNDSIYLNKDVIFENSWGNLGTEAAPWWHIRGRVIQANEVIDFPVESLINADTSGTPKTILSTAAHGAIARFGEGSAYLAIGSSGIVQTQIYGNALIVKPCFADGVTEWSSGYTPAATIGKAVIASGQASVYIAGNVTTNSHVFLTKRVDTYANADTAGLVLEEIIPASGLFKIATADGSNVTSNYEFSWFVLN